jgi:hypothetical protein
MRADTLILRPQALTADILWRTSWPAAMEPEENYRKVQMRRGGF